MTEKHLTETRFDALGLSTAVLQGLNDLDFQYCTPIQAQTLPLSLQGRDVAGQAQTGTGKTAAFLLAILHRLTLNPAAENRRQNQPRALVLVPTRELAVQIHHDASQLAAHTDLVVHAVFGGTGYEKQRRALQEGVDILIGTPGRLIDYYKQHVFDLRAIEAVVLDEADRMFDLGFIKDVRYMLRRCPSPDHRLGMLFSATLSYRVTELAYEHMNNPEIIEVQPEQVTAERIEEYGFMVANEEKVPLLLGLLQDWQDARAIIFVNTKKAADIVWGYLEGNGIQTAILTGDVPQKKRMSLLQRFAENAISALVATDVAARGLHIPDVSHVINYDLPEDAEDYVHRIGRTARAGASGEAISFVCETFAYSLPDIEQYVGYKIPIEAPDSALIVEVDPNSRIMPERPPRHRHGGKDGRPRGQGKGRRRSRPKSHSGQSGS